MQYGLKINDISEYTGLSDWYVRDATKKLGEILDPYISRGDKNSLLFDSNAKVIFDQIKQLKDSGLSLSSIKEKLLEELNQNTKNRPQTESQTPLNLPEIASHAEHLIPIKEYLSKFEEHHKLVLELKDQLYQKEKEVWQYKSNLLLLTDGRTAEEVSRENRERLEQLIRSQEAIKKIEEEKQNALKEQENKLHEKNKELFNTQEKLMETNKSLEVKEHRLKSLNSLIEELNQLKWWDFRRRKELLQEIKSFS